MSFSCFPPNFFSQNTVEKSSYFGSKFSEIFSKKNDLLFLSNKMINRNVVKNHQLFLSNSNKLSLFIPSKAKNNYNELTVNNIHLLLESCDKKTPKEIEYIFLDCFHKNETSSEVKNILKDSGLDSFEKKQLLSIWANQLLKKQAEIYDLIDLLDSDIYSNEALIVLGKKLIPLVSKAPNKLQNLFNIYFKIGNCYSHENELKKALKQYKTAEKFLKYTDVHHHFLFYFNVAKTKKQIGLQPDIEEQQLMYYYLSKENWEKKLYKNDLKEYFQFSA